MKRKGEKEENKRAKEKKRREKGERMSQTRQI